MILDFFIAKSESIYGTGESTFNFELSNSDEGIFKKAADVQAFSVKPDGTTSLCLNQFLKTDFTCKLQS